MLPRPLLPIVLALCLFGCTSPEPAPVKQSGAGKAMDLWTLQRAYPGKTIKTSQVTRAYRQSQSEQKYRGEGFHDWHNIGPDNIAGRTLCLGFDPYSNDIIYAGSASGGLWKTTSAGKGENAWEHIPTGFPVLGVSAIAIHPQNPSVMYIGTGEIYNAEAATPGVVDRLTRGTYGIGILKTIDGGKHWNLVLDWQQTDLKGVQEILIHPVDNKIVYAATTEGLMRSENGGSSWELIHDVPMATDVDVHPDRPERIFVCYGSLNNTMHGVFRSTDGGEHFELMSNGLPGYNGKARLAIHEANPDLIYVSLANESKTVGLFKSYDGGDRWIITNNTNVASYQGWYSHDVAISPASENEVIWAGIEVWKSTNGGQQMQKVSMASDGDYGQVPVGGPEGSIQYVHADVHRIYYHPNLTDHIYFATDGGVFASENRGLSFEGRNGGLTTSQFYANFSTFPSNADLAIGGMQDNGTAIYLGDRAWSKVLGGDGMSTAFHPYNDQLIYASLQRLEIRRTTNGGLNFFRIGPYMPANETRSFNAPYVMSPVNSEILYAGSDRIYRSRNGGNSWQAMDNGPIKSGNPILRIFPSPFDYNDIFVSIAPLKSGTAALFKSYDGGASWTSVQQTLPNRICTDLVFDPKDSSVIWAVFSGYQTHHVFRSQDGGMTWVSRNGNLPDVPVNVIRVLPKSSACIIVGTDLGVYYSENGGQHWSWVSESLGDGIMVSDFNLLKGGQELRVITHGRGVFDVSLPPITSTSVSPGIEMPVLQIYPNPTDNQFWIQFPALLDRPESVKSVHLFDSKGVRVNASHTRTGKNQISCRPKQWESGIYFVRVEGKDGQILWGRVIKK